MAGDPPAVWHDPRNIRYLSFQGGGGKGLAYLGALDWLERHHGPLPLAPRNKGLHGLSGASAGAMTAMLVAVGYSSLEIQDVYAKIKLADLVDTPDYGTVRCVSSDQNVLTLGSPVRRAAVLTGSIVRAVLSELSVIPKNSLLYALMSDPGYLACLIYDGGMLSGVALRNWLGKQILKSPLWRTRGRRLNLPRDGLKITFDHLHQMSAGKVELAITGTNITTGRPVVFATTSTPDFPVADAVAMSASLPPVFKPVWVSSTAPIGSDIATENYVGWYVDGGVTNNVPIHAFDQEPVSFDPYFDQSPPGPQGPLPLNEYMLGLRLTAGEPPSAQAAKPVQDPPSTTQWLYPTLGQLVDALQFGANMGQLHSQAEAMQTVLIYSDGVGLIDFIPQTDAQLKAAVRYGRQQMSAYYSNPTPPR
jgi:predicted acylesterase/phospholipase RssA